MKSVIPARKRRQFAQETRLAKVRRARKIDRILARVFPDARAELDFTNPFELLIATVLSAQTTDVRVNQVTPELFARYPSAHELAVATREDVEVIIRPTGFFRSKAANVIALAIQLVERHGGEVPRTQKELVKLPGVGVKTANVVLGNAFDTRGSPWTHTWGVWPGAWGSPPTQIRSKSRRTYKISMTRGTSPWCRIG